MTTEEHISRQGAMGQGNQRGASNPVSTTMTNPFTKTGFDTATMFRGVTEAATPAIEAWPDVPIWKRPLDLLLIALTLPITGPLMLLIAALIKIVSPGPVFYSQDRIGRKGEVFRLFKFRTMTHNSGVDSHKEHLKGLMQSNVPMAKLDHVDPRVIRGGRILRASGLDELAQLINVARGEMSLVGPRPCTPYEFEHYQAWQKKRFGAIPGLTGLWQVSGKNQTTFSRMVELDINYTRNQSIWMDLWILTKTPRVVLGQVFEMLRRVSRSKVRTSESATPSGTI